MTDLLLSRGAFDVGLVTNREHAMLAFWRDHIDLPVEGSLRPVPGVTQHRLTLRGAVLKLNHVEAPLPERMVLGGPRMLLLASTDVDAPVHERDPDGNVVCFVPPGTAGIERFGVHLAVSDEDAFHDFYARILGLPRVAERAYDFAGATLSFAWSPDVVPDSARGGAGFSYLTFQVLDAEEAHALLCERGVEEDLPPSADHTTTESTISFIRDPDGNRIELSQRPDLVARADLSDPHR